MTRFFSGNKGNHMKLRGKQGTSHRGEYRIAPQLNINFRSSRWGSSLQGLRNLDPRPSGVYVWGFTLVTLARPTKSQHLLSSCTLTSEPEGIAPARGGAAPARGGAAPSRGGAAPAQGCVAPACGGTAPARGGAAQARGGTAPARGDLKRLTCNGQQKNLKSPRLIKSTSFGPTLQ